MSARTQRTRTLYVYAIRFYLNAIVAGGNAAVLHLHVGRRMGELAVGVRARAFVALILAAHLQLQPARVLAAEQSVHVHHGSHLC